MVSERLHDQGGNPLPKPDPVGNNTGPEAPAPSPDALPALTQEPDAMRIVDEDDGA